MGIPPENGFDGGDFSTLRHPAAKGRSTAFYDSTPTFLRPGRIAGQVSW
jgi:hypothetical protein